jgi:hypothetical protein
LSERAVLADGPLKASAATAAGARAGVWARYGKYFAVFALLMLGYMLSFSCDENDALDTAYWMEKGDIRSLLEFRHLVQRMLPLWLWQGMNGVGWKVPALTLLNVWDFASAAASVMLLYTIVHLLTASRPISFGATFAYGTAHCVWLYTGSGRLYSTSMFLIFAAFYLALKLGEERGEARRWILALSAATYVCFAGLFWLVHVFSGISVGLIILLLATQVSWRRRLAYVAAFGAFGLVLTVAIAVSCLLYVQIPLEAEPIQAWMAAAGTQPMRFDALSPMKASFGHAHGILAMYPLPYLINGLMLKDPHLAQIGSFPWEFSKFAFVWVLLILVYMYPLWLLWRGDGRRRILIALLYLPLAINLYFALGWLGSDVQRFMPTMLSQFVLAAFSVQDLLARVRKPRLAGAALAACLLFIAAVNLAESLLPSQRNHMELAAAMRSIRPYTRPNDLMINFGRDLPISYQTMTRYYGGAMFLTATNDAPTYDWDRADWQQNLERIRLETEARGGRMLVMDRLALGMNPVSAAWSERQHPNPTVKQFAAYLRSRYCVIPALYVGQQCYYHVAAREGSCPAGALAEEPSR